MIRIEAIWLATEHMDMRAGTETALARVIAVFGAAMPHCAYLFANRRANRMKVLVHDGIGVWLAARRLNQGKFHWPGIRQGGELELDTVQLQALVLGLPWQLAGRWNYTYRQQSSRKPDQAVGAWTLELVVCRVASQR